MEVIQGYVEVLRDIPPVNDSPISRLPDEILLKIFQHGARLEGTLPFYKRITAVCNRWHRISSDRQLWRNVDLSYSWVEKTATVWQQLCENRFSNLEVLRVHDWQELDLSLLKNNPRLGSVDISHCRLPKYESWIHVIATCKRLRTIRLTDIRENDISLSVSLYLLICWKGQYLQVLDMSRNVMTVFDFLQIFGGIAILCRSLIELDLRVDMDDNLQDVVEQVLLFYHCRRDVFPFRKLQANCHRMTILRLPSLPFTDPNEEEEPFDGFPRLREFTMENVINSASNRPSDYRSVQAKIRPKMAFLRALLKESRELTILNVANYSMNRLNTLKSRLNLPNLPRL